VDVERPYGEAAAGMSGLETTLGLVLEAVDAGRLGLVRAIRALTLGPWRALDAGRFDVAEPGLRAGSDADLVVFDRADRWDVTTEALRSRGHNTPLLGRALPGRVLFTIARGRLAWVDPGAASE
jgi:dihydroorotase